MAIIRKVTTEVIASVIAVIRAPIAHSVPVTERVILAVMPMPAIVASYVPVMGPAIIPVADWNVIVTMVIQAIFAKYNVTDTELM